MAQSDMTKEDKLRLLEKMGLRPSENFGQVREKVWRPRSDYLRKVQTQWHDYDGVSETSVRKAKSLAAQRNRQRRK